MVVKKDRWWGGGVKCLMEAWRDRDARGINCKPLLRGERGDPLCFLPQDCFPQTQGYRKSKVEDEAARWKNSLWWRCEVHLLNTVCSMCSETGRSTQHCQDLVKLWLQLTSESCDEQNNVAHIGHSLARHSELTSIKITLREKSEHLMTNDGPDSLWSHALFFTIHITDIRSAVTVHGTL